MPDAAEKRCVICGSDCANAPRIRDRSGRYAHRACAAKAQTQSMNPAVAVAPTPFAAETAVPLVTEEPDVMAALLDDVASAPGVGTVETQVSCPGCGYAMAPETIICMHCGTNAQTGRGVQTRVVRPKTDHVAPTPARFGLAAISAGVGAAAGAGIWIAIALAADAPHRGMVFLLGAIVASAALIPVRGRGGRVIGTIAAGLTLLGTIGALAVTPPDRPEGFVVEMPEFDLTYAVIPPTESQSAAFTAAWVALAALTAFGLASTNPHDGEEDDR